MTCNTVTRLKKPQARDRAHEEESDPEREPHEILSASRQGGRSDLHGHRGHHPRLGADSTQEVPQFRSIPTLAAFTYAIAHLCVADESPTEDDGSPCDDVDRAIDPQPRRAVLGGVRSAGVLPSSRLWAAQPVSNKMGIPTKYQS